MSKSVFKRKFLVKDCEVVKKYLRANSQSFKLYKYTDKNSLVYGFKDFTYILEKYKKIDILILISDKNIEPFMKLDEVTKDKRYSKEYLKWFGNPTSYEFEPKEVFKKCDSIGLRRLDLHFMAGMDSIKVFRVLLYRLNQIFSLNYASFVNDDLSYDILQDSHKRLKAIYKLSKNLFYNKITKLLLEDMSDLYILLSNEDKINRYLFNFELFIREDSSFYNKNKKNTPIYLFIKKNLSKSQKTTNKKYSKLYHQSRFSKEMISKIDKLVYIQEYFFSILSEDENKELNLQIQALKKSNY